MELDPRSIKRSDFATSRRGYDQQEVDAHLSEVAEAVEELKGAGGGSAPMASSTAAARVKAVIEAAEVSAADLEKAAREDAERITAQARSDAEVQLERARAATARLVDRAAEIERELDELAQGVRASVAELGETVRGQVEALDAELRTLGAELAGAGRATPAAAGEQGAAQVDEQLVAEAETLASPEPEPSPGGAPRAPEGARVLALKMALDGSSREQTAHYLRENFELPDPDALLDEVYSRAGR